jgi:hypothetical protein
VLASAAIVAEAAAAGAEVVIEPDPAEVSAGAPEDPVDAAGASA